ncbi:uncharacterized protein [Notamacropus eugenii]|uniref:uncharacterized protein n=1 Tax=Notamacropus eugenii TaxID=9315 RepID=UPI003B66E83E
MLFGPSPLSSLLAPSPPPCPLQYKEPGPPIPRIRAVSLAVLGSTYGPPRLPQKPTSHPCPSQRLPSGLPLYGLVRTSVSRCLARSRRFGSRAEHAHWPALAAGLRFPEGRAYPVRLPRGAGLDSDPTAGPGALTGLAGLGEAGSGRVGPLPPASPARQRGTAARTSRPPWGPPPPGARLPRRAALRPSSSPPGRESSCLLHGEGQPEAWPARRRELEAAERSDPSFGASGERTERGKSRARRVRSRPPRPQPVYWSALRGGAGPPGQSSATPCPSRGALFPPPRPAAPGVFSSRDSCSGPGSEAPRAPLSSWVREAHHPTPIRMTLAPQEPPRRKRSRGHGLRPPGIGDVPGCGCGLYPRGVGAPGPCPEGAVPGGDAGELPEPCLPGT